ncbi:hypothetical protein Leryth_014427, partial [Lithospermum erythrorhizon]
TEFCSSEKTKCSIDGSIATKASSGTINLVAKLMGLDSIPIGNLQKDLRAVTRSRSMNSAETWKGFEAMQGMPRRTKSFREIPCFLELEDENFFILSFENGRKNRSLASKVKEPEKGSIRETEKLREWSEKVSGELKKINENKGRSKIYRRGSVYEKNKEYRIIKQNCTPKGGFETVMQDKTNVQDQRGTNHSGKKQFSKLREPVSKKKDSVGGKTRIKKRRDDFLVVKTIGTDINSQSSRPDSVLEDVQLPVSGNANCPEVSSRLISPTSRRTLWEELKNYIKQNNTGKNQTSTPNDQDATENKQNGNISSNNVDLSKIHAKILKCSSNVAKEEMLKSKWILKDAWKLEDYVKVGENLEAGILDQLMDELIDQLTDT